MAVSNKRRDLTLLDPQVFEYAIMYMHGRHEFALGKNEQNKLRDYIKQGGVLFSDACCGMPAYDRSFRRLMEQLFPDNPLKRIPPDHEIFTSKIGGHDLKTVKRREPDGGNPQCRAWGRPFRTVEPFLEGIEIDGRFGRHLFEIRHQLHALDAAGILWPARGTSRKTPSAWA